MNTTEATHALLNGYRDGFSEKVTHPLFPDNVPYMRGWDEGVADCEAYWGRQTQGKRSQPTWNAARYVNGSAEQQRRKASRPVKVKGGGV